jgi:predicted amidohydrolase
VGIFRVATTQLRGEKYSDLKGLIAYLEQFLNDDKAVEILVLPEYALLPLLKEQQSVTRAEVRKLYDEVFQEMETDMVEEFKNLALKYNTNILVGSHWTFLEDKPYNASFFFTDSGDVHVHAKCYPTPPEEAMGMHTGKKLALIELSSGVKIGILICFDIEFPELARDLAYQGADILLVPSLTLNERGANRVELCARSRAIENQVYVVSSTNQAQLQIPIEKPIQSVGKAGIFGQIDNKTRLTDGIVKQAKGEGDMILAADLNLDILKDSRYSSEAPLRKHMKEVTI